jgi:hypothetical protein
MTDELSVNRWGPPRMCRVGTSKVVLIDALQIIVARMPNLCSLREFSIVLPFFMQ